MYTKVQLNVVVVLYFTDYIRPMKLIPRLPENSHVFSGSHAVGISFLLHVEIITKNILILFFLLPLSPLLTSISSDVKR